MKKRKEIIEDVKFAAPMILVIWVILCAVFIPMDLACPDGPQTGMFILIFGIPVFLIGTVVGSVIILLVEMHDENKNKK